MFDKLIEVEKRFDEINEQLMDPAVVTDQKLYASLMKEMKNLTPIVEKFREYKKTKSNLEEAKQLVDDPEMGEMAKMEIEELTPSQKRMLELMRETEAEKEKRLKEQEERDRKAL